MKKLLSIIIAVIFMMTMLAACGEPANEPIGTQPEVNQPVAGNDDGNAPATPNAGDDNAANDENTPESTPEGDAQTTEPEVTEPEVTEPEPIIDDVSYSFSDGTLTISGTGRMEDYLYSGSTDKFSPWYSQRDLITSVVIELGVTHIGNGAFNGCGNLTDITLPDSITSIGNGAFFNCTNLTGVTIPDSVTSIGASAFGSCESLTSIIIPDSVTSIGAGAFTWCLNLEDITIPNNTVDIGDGAFSYCNNLTSATISGHLGKYVFQACYKLTEVNILNADIGEWAFAGEDSNSPNIWFVTIADGVTGIGDYAFYGCKNLYSINIPDSVTYIGTYAFAECGELTDVVIPSSVTSIEDFTFYESKLVNITIPTSVTSLGQGALYCKNLTDIYYGGTEEQWKALTDGVTTGIPALTCTVHYGA